MAIVSDVSKDFDIDGFEDFLKDKESPNVQYSNSMQQQSKQNKYTYTDWYADPEVAERAERVMQSTLNDDWVADTLGVGVMDLVNSKIDDTAVEKLVSRLRRDDWTNFGAFGTSGGIKNESKEIREDMAWLKNKWESIDDFGSYDWWKGVGENGLHMLGDPTNYIGIGLGMKGLKGTRILASKLDDGLTKQALTMLASNSKLANVGRLAGAGFGWGVLGNSGQQNLNMALDLQKDYDYGEAASTGLLTAAAVPAIVGGAYSLGALGIGAKGLSDKIFRSNTGDKIIERGTDELEVANNLSVEINAPKENSITLEDAQQDNYVYTKDVEDSLMSVLPDEESLLKTQKFNANKAREASKRVNQEAKEERLWGGFIPDSQVNDILEQYEIDKLDFENYMLEYEANRDLPNIDDADDYLMEEVGEVLYGLNKPKQTKEFALASFKNYRERGRRQGVDPMSKAIDALIIMSKEAEAVVPDNIKQQANKLTEKVGGGPQTQAEIQDTLYQVSNGTISPDDARAVLLKKTERLHGKYAWGRATKVLTKFKKDSSTSNRLAEIIRYDSLGNFSNEVRQVGSDFNEIFTSYSGELYSNLYKALEPIKNSSFGKLRDVMNTEVYRAVLGKKSSNPTINKAAGEIRNNVLNLVVAKNKELGDLGDTNIIEGYFPRMWDRKAIEKDFYGTNRLLSIPKRKNQLRASGNNIFAQKLLRDKEASTIEEAYDIVEEMLSKGDQYNVSAGPLGNASGSFFSSRKFTNIKNDLDYEEFLDTDINNVLFQYITQAGNNYTKRKALGVDSLEKFKEKWIAPIQEEVIKAQGKGGFTETDGKDIETLYQSLTGEGRDDLPFGNTIRDTASFLIRTSTLTLAQLSSLAESALLLEKGGTEAAKSFGKAIGQGSEVMLNNIRRRLLKEHNLKDPEIMDEMREAFFFVENAAISAADRLTDVTLSNNTFKKMSRIYFKGTLLDIWTKTMQLAGFNLGKSLIHKNLKAISDHGNLAPTPRITELRQQLAEVNVPLNEGLAYIKRNEGEINKKDPFYRTVKSGAARFTREIVLDSSARTALKPAWMSNPKVPVLAELQGYPTAFTNVKLKNFAKGLKNYDENPVRARGVVATLAAGTAIGFLTNAIRNPEKFAEQSPQENLVDAGIRFGLSPVPLENITRTYQYGEKTNYGKAALGLLGPAGSDVARYVSYGDLGSIIGGRMPGYTGMELLLGRDFKYNYDKTFKNLFKEERSPYDKGGIVDVDRASEEPDERIDKVTGRPYDSQAGEAYIDEEDRLERNKYMAGGLSKVVSPFVEVLTDLILTTTKENNIKVSKSGAEKVAKNLEEKYGKADIDNISEIENDPDFQEYIMAETKASIDEKNDISTEDLQKQMPEFFDERGQLIGGEEFSKARGYTPEQILNYARAGELKDMYAAEGRGVDEVGKVIKYELDSVGARKPESQWEDKFAVYMEDTTDYDAKEIEDIYNSFTDEDQMLARKIFSKMPEKSKQIDYSVPEKQRKANQKLFIAESQEKQLQYRAVAKSLENEFEEAVAMPNETGLHVGTLAQAERMALFRRQGDEDIYDQDGSLTSRQLSNRLKKPLEEGETTPPIAMMRGYIQVKTPLQLNDPNFALYSDASKLFDMPGTMANILDAVLSQAPKLNPSKFNAARDNLYQKILDYEAWQAEVTGGTLTKFNDKDFLIDRLKKADLNITFRKMLEDQGFDSIKYLNTSDTPPDAETKDAFSYILFKPNQFKSDTAIEYDVEDPRHNFTSGGKVLQALKRKAA